MYNNQNQIHNSASGMARGAQLGHSLGYLKTQGSALLTNIYTIYHGMISMIIIYIYISYR